jgi:DcrB
MLESRMRFGPFSFEAPPSSAPPRLIMVFRGHGDETAPQYFVQREHMNKGEDVQAFAWRRLVEMTRDATGMAVIEPTPTVLVSRQAFRMALEWEADATRMREAIAMVDAGDGSVLALSCLSRAADAPAAFERLLASVALEGAPRASAVAPSTAPSRRSPPPPLAHYAVPMPGSSHAGRR